MEMGIQESTVTGENHYNYNIINNDDNGEFENDYKYADND